MPQEPPQVQNRKPIPPDLATTPPVVLIVEMNGDGHRLQYVSLLALDAVGKGCRVVLALAPDMPSSLIDMHLSSALLMSEVVRTEARTVTDIDALATELGASTVIVPDGDRHAVEIGRGRRWRSHARLRILVMRWDAQTDGRRFAVAAHLKLLAKRSLILQASRQPLVDVFILRSPLWQGAVSLPIVRDPVFVCATDEGTRQLRKDWDLTGDRMWLGVIGAVSGRKNVNFVAGAMKRVRRRKLGLLVAGMVDSEVLAQLEADNDELKRAGHKIVIVNRLLTDAEIDCAVAASDVVVVAHSNEGPSGLLLKSKAIGTTVFAAGALSLRQDLILMGRGNDRWCELNAEAMAGVLAEINPARQRTFGTHASVDSFVQPLIGVSPSG